MEEDIKQLKEKIETDYKDMVSIINSTSLPLFVEDTIEDMHILIEKLIARNKDLEVEIFAYKNNLGNYTRKVIKEVFNDYLLKSKVKEKIEELEKEIEEKQERGTDFTLIHEHEIDTNGIIQVLQELLED